MELECRRNCRNRERYLIAPMCLQRKNSSHYNIKRYSKCKNGGIQYHGTGLHSVAAGAGYVKRISRLQYVLASGRIRGMKFLITAGPTREAIDPVRYLTNRSSGRMGYALAGAARHEGHEVLLISGPTKLDVPPGVDFIQVESAQQMYDAVRDMLKGVDVAILCAAVADYRPVAVAEQKIKKNSERLVLELERTPDILGSMRTEFGFTGKLVGFAAETQNLVEYARGKLLRKQCDFVVGNDVSQPGIGFDSRENAVVLVYPEHEVYLEKDSKEHIAMHIIEHATILS